MKKLRFGVIGCGFWSRYQLAGWREAGGAECVAVCDCDPVKAHRLAEEFGIAAAYGDAREMVSREKLDFLDIITDVNSHADFVRLGARSGLAVICQKPMAPNFLTASGLVETCRRSSVPFLVHENWRWQTPLRQLNALLSQVEIGPCFRARVTYTNSFPVFDNQPFLKDLEQFILTDMGTHILDVIRFLFGEARSLYCRTHKTRSDIRGENAASLLLDMASGISVACELGYAGVPREDRFPEVFVTVEGADGSIELGPDFWIHVTTRSERYSRRFPPPCYSWSAPAYALVHSSIVACNRNLLHGLQWCREVQSEDTTIPSEETLASLPAETTGRDNLDTLRLVFAAYDSARHNRVIDLAAWTPD